MRGHGVGPLAELGPDAGNLLANPVANLHLLFLGQGFVPLPLGLTAFCDSARAGQGGDDRLNEVGGGIGALPRFECPLRPGPSLLLQESFENGGIVIVRAVMP
jgi:hypothetical protein